jgi:cell division protein ZapA
MAQVSVTIGGRAFRLACNPGEEAHLESLARGVDAKIAQMRASFGEIGDQRLVVMAALTIADELSEAQTAIAAHKQRVEASLEAEQSARGQAEARTHSLSKALDEMCLRVETLAATLAGATKD